ncbi:MAG: hypothetical protein N3B12_00950 [Armatimonadetes bacterium]|nr:hypothetical protein [Armatimonadota bacterium]
MQIQLSLEGQAKIEDILEQLHMRYDLEDLTPEQLIEALLDLASDMVVAEEPGMPLGRDRLISYCGSRITLGAA